MLPLFFQKRLWILGLSILVSLIAGNSAALTGKININSASVKELELLPYIGEARAKAIVKYRNKKGHFKNLNQIQYAADIGPKTFEAIKPYLLLSGQTSLKSEGSKNSRKANSAPKKKTVFKHVSGISSNPNEIKILADKEYYETLIDAIRGAKHEIRMAMFLFKMTKSAKNRPAKVAKELIKARQRGIEIEILLEKSGYDGNINKENKKVANRLKNNQINVYFDSARTTTHTKLVVIDGKYSFVGSHNLTDSALAYNNELTLLIDNKKLAKEINRYIDALIH